VQAVVRKQVLADNPPLHADWLFVTAPARSVEVPKGASGLVLHNFEVTMEAQASTQRLVIVGNHVGDPAIDREGSFVVLRVK
jgi:hypothetical protein